MEVLRSDSNEELTAFEENDEFYEKIEAPKFVDFTVPDRSKPDDKSWFCLRIGCDQQHEEVDPDALYRSFMLRVMAARSPNIKYQKALNIQAPRSIKKCPRTAPAKSVKDSVSRLSTITSIPDKMAHAKMKNHPVSTLRSTPTNTKTKVQPLTSDKKALTTPRTKKWPSIHDPFCSAKHQKAPVPIPKIGNVAKALFLGTPKKTDEGGKLKFLNSEVCDVFKKLSLGSLKNKTVKMHLSAKKVEETSCTSSKRNEVVVMTKNVEENLPTSSELILKECQQSLRTDSTNSTNFEDDSEQNTQPSVANNVNEYDDDKENDSSVRIVNSSTTNSESESLQFETNENIPHKEMRAASKNIQNHGKQAAQVKRTTNPKPFRLRTNERGILKEANLEKKMKLEAQKETASNLEKKMKLEAQKETASVLRHGDEKHHNITLEKKHQLNLEGQTSQPNQTRTTRVRYVKSRYATSIPKCHKAEGKKTEESQNDILKTASSRQNLKAKSERSPRKAEVFKVKLANNKPPAENVMANVTFLKGKNPSAVQKESNFQRLHPPKSCPKRQQGKVMA